MSTHPSPLDGDVVINNEDDFSLGELIDALYADPRFLAMVRNIMLIDARRKGNEFGQWAQQSAPSTATRNRLT